MLFRQRNKLIYLDYAAATPVSKQALREMNRAHKMAFGNPGGIHTQAEVSRRTLEDARTRIARKLHVRPRGVIFTSSATEANNLMVFGIPKKGHIITSTIEHASVYEPIKKLEAAGWSVTYIEPDERGHIAPDGVAAAVRADTVLVSIIYVQNEIGTVQPISAIARAVREAAVANTRPLLHTDAAQAGALFSLDIEALRVDALTVSSQKLYGPRGAAALVIKPGITLNARVVGGGQEGGLRAGTPNVSAIVGFAEALCRAQEDASAEHVRLAALNAHARAYLSAISGMVMNGEQPLSPHIINCSFNGVDGEQLAIMLDVAGIAVSTGSACSTDAGASHVVERMFGTGSRAAGSLRISLGRGTTKRQLDRACVLVRTAVETLRTHAQIVANAAPLYDVSSNG